MTALHALVLGIVQGLTEFLPVSSSGHLVVVPWVLGWDSPGLVFDTTVHWGTLLAVVIYFWSDLVNLIVAGWNGLVKFSLEDPEAKLAWGIVVATIPGALAGALLDKWFESLFQKPMYVGVALLVTASILFVSERIGRRSRGTESINWLDAILIGTAQAFAIIPGISRSGATMSTGLARNLRREVAARYSFLLSIPIIFGAGLFKLKDLLETGVTANQATVLLVGFAAAAISGYLAIDFLMKFVRTKPFYIFAAYCLLAGLFVLGFGAFVR
jgi:undecaprenyl-diphosphatase